MTAAVLCALAFFISFFLGRRSLSKGLCVVFSVGYLYGLLRAQIPQMLSHFLFDAAVAGLYLSQFFRSLSLEERYKLSWLRPWFLLLIGWPILLFFVPFQEMLIQLVGLRGNIFFLPFFLLGALLTGRDRYTLALWIAGLNLLAFGFAGAEFFLGVDRFIPYREQVTTIVYQSTDVAGRTAWRIPACFPNAHAYAGTMVVTLPLLIGAWGQPYRRRWHTCLLGLAMIAALLGVFMAATRTFCMISILLVLVMLISRKLDLRVKILWLLFLLGIGWIVAREERLQRFTTLQDSTYVRNRLYGSMNERFLDLLLAYPLGNGLGGGGTSLPYFLQSKVRGPGGLENEYCRILLELGLPGLCLWVSWLFWGLMRRNDSHDDRWWLGKKMAWYVCAFQFSTGLIGIGLLTSIPQTALLFLSFGWLVFPERMLTHEK